MKLTDKELLEVVDVLKRSTSLATFLWHANTFHGTPSFGFYADNKANFKLRKKAFLDQIFNTLCSDYKNDLIELVLTPSKEIEIDSENPLQGDKLTNQQLNKNLEQLILKLRAIVIAYEIAYKANKKFANYSNVDDSSAHDARLFHPSVRQYFKSIKPGLIKHFAELELESAEQALKLNDAEKLEEFIQERIDKCVALAEEKFSEQISCYTYGDVTAMSKSIV